MSALKEGSVRGTDWRHLHDEFDAHGMRSCSALILVVTVARACKRILAAGASTT